MRNFLGPFLFCLVVLAPAGLAAPAPQERAPVTVTLVRWPYT